MVENLHQGIAEAFQEATERPLPTHDPQAYLRDLGTPDELDDFFDELAYAFEGELEDEQRAAFTQYDRPRCGAVFLWPDTVLKPTWPWPTLYTLC